MFSAERLCAWLHPGPKPKAFRPAKPPRGKNVRQPLTARQREALDFITYCLDERGYPPTLREIGEHMGIRSTNGVNDHLKALERKGYLRREDMKSRALKLVEESLPTPVRAPLSEDDIIDVPVLGRVAAGLPLL